MVKLYRNNVRIRQAADRDGVFMWEVARKIGVNPTKLSKMMRDEIPVRSDLYKEIMNAIREVKAEHEKK